MALLTVAQLHDHVTTALSDDALGRLLEAAEQAIIARAGAAGTVTDIRVGGSGLLTLSRRAASITSVVEQWLLDVHPDDVADAVFAAEFWQAATALNAADYALSADGYTLQRLGTGPNPAETWDQAVKVTYPAFDDVAERRRVQLALVRLDLNYNPGLASQTVEGFQEGYSANSLWNYQAERDAILATLPRKRWAFA